MLSAKKVSQNPSRRVVRLKLVKTLLYQRLTSCSLPLVSLLCYLRMIFTVRVRKFLECVTHFIDVYKRPLVSTEARILLQVSHLSDHLLLIQRTLDVLVVSQVTSNSVLPRQMFRQHASVVTSQKLRQSRSMAMTKSHNAASRSRTIKLSVKGQRTKWPLIRTQHRHTRIRKASYS